MVSPVEQVKLERAVWVCALLCVLVGLFGRAVKVRPCSASSPREEGAHLPLRAREHAAAHVGAARVLRHGREGRGERAQPRRRLGFCRRRR